MPDTDLSPVFLAASDPAPKPQERADRAFERLVNADLRDKFAAGPAYKILSRPENLVRWLQTLTAIRQSILSQNTHDNAALQAHPGRGDSGQATREYLEAKKFVADRKRSRERALRAATDRVGEVRRMIGAHPMAGPTLGVVIQHLVHADLLLQDGDVEQAREKLAVLLVKLQPAVGTEVRDA